MRKKILVSLMLLMLAGTSMAQLRKKKKEAPADTVASKTAVSDTVKVASNAGKPVPDSLKVANDSLSAELVQYKNFYVYIRDRFFPEKYKQIDVEAAIPLADSLKAASADNLKGLQSLSASKIDSLSLLLKEADTLRLENQTFKALLISLIGENIYPLNEAELKGSWQVFVQPVKVMGAGQESAIVSMDRLVMSDSLYRSCIKEIVFLEEDLADIHFFGGKKTKCFYKVTGFSRDKTYSISLQKGDEINIKLFITPVPRGLQVSYKSGKTNGQYMYGYMRK